MGDALRRRCWLDLLGDVMRHIKCACTLLQAGCLLGLLLALPIGLNSGSTAFADTSSIGLSAEDAEHIEDAAGSVSDSLSSDIAQEGESSDESLDSASEGSMRPLTRVPIFLPRLCRGIECSMLRAIR